MRNKKFELNRTLVNKVITTVDAGLSSGLGDRKPGEMCVEAAVCYAMGLPHSDRPTCVHPLIRDVKIGLNDSNWSSKAARAKGMRRLAVLQLGTMEMSPAFDAVAFAKKLALETIRTVLPIALAACGLHTNAEECKAATTLEEGEAAASRAASRAARYAASDAASDAVSRAASAASDAASAASRAVSRAARYAVSRAARYAARYAASAASDAASDAVLTTFAHAVESALIEQNVPAVSFLPLLDKE